MPLTWVCCNQCRKRNTLAAASPIRYVQSSRYHDIDFQSERFGKIIAEMRGIN
jgi:hypothetical protein